jgi:hypothetical protein
MSGRSGRWVAEFVLVVVGVLAAFGIENWRQSRSDISVEGHLLEGIAADLMRDLQDLEGAIASAQARIAATDELLRLVGDPDAGVLVRPCPDRAPPNLVCGSPPRALEPNAELYPPGSLAAQEALLIAGHILRFDVSDASYSEARASGEMELIRDAELRAAIAAYYAVAVVTGGTVDDRLGAAVPRFIDNLEQVGLSPAGGSSDDQIAATIRRAPVLIAGLKNVRYAAVYQLAVYRRQEADTRALRERVTEALAVTNGDR